MAPKKKKASKSSDRSPLAATRNPTVGKHLVAVPNRLVNWESETVLRKRPVSTNTDEPSKILRIRFILAHSLDAEGGQTHKYMRFRFVSPLKSLILKVDSSMQIPELERSLRPLLWIPFFERYHLSLLDGTLLADKHPYGTLSGFGVEDMDVLLVVMDGFHLYKEPYLRLLVERGDMIYPRGAGPEPLVIRPEKCKLKICFKLVRLQKPVDSDPRDSIVLEVDPELQIGLLMIKVATRFWIPWYQDMQLCLRNGPALTNQYLTLEDYGVKDGDTLFYTRIYRSLFDHLEKGEVFSLVKFFLLGKLMQVFVEAAHYLDSPCRYPERSENQRYIVRLMVAPTLTIGALKSKLEPFHWIPRKNLVLFSNKSCASASEDNDISIFKDDNTTLADYGVKDGDTLISCTDAGRFQVRVYNYRTMTSFRISVSSCFESIGEVKKKIHRRKGYPPEDQILTPRSYNNPPEDGTPLAVWGVVKPFMKQMETQVYHLKLRVRKH